MHVRCSVHESQSLFCIAEKHIETYCGVRKIGDRRQPLTPTLSPLLRRGAREKIGPAVRAV
jgi:hypothetical protein